MLSRLRSALLVFVAAVTVACGSSPPAPAAAPQKESGVSANAPADSSLLALTRDVRLPGATNAQEVFPDAPVVSVVGTEVRVDGNVVADTAPILAEHRVMRVDGLWTALAERQQAWKQDPAHAGAAFPGVVMMAFSDDAIAVVVKSIFYTAAFAGFPNAGFLVRTPSGVGSLAVDAQVPGPKSAPQTSASQTNGGLTTEQVRQVVMSHAGALRACYEISLQRDSSLGSGTLIASWRIDVHGAVQDVAIVSSELRSADLERCALRQIRSWVFPASNTTPTAIAAYPFRFGATH